MTHWTTMGLMLLSMVGCSTLGPQQMANIGDETPKANVMGKASHFDIAGIGVPNDQFVEEYNAAVANAFSKAPTGTKRLVSLKSFRSQNWAWNALGAVAVGVGGSLGTMYQTQYVSLGLLVAGLPLLFVNNNDFVLVGEPSEV